MTDRLAAALVELVEAIRAEVAAVSAAPVPDRLLSIEEAADVLGLGRTATYAEIAGGRLRTLKIGRRRLVPSSALAAYTNPTRPPCRCHRVVVPTDYEPLWETE